MTEHDDPAAILARAAQRGREAGLPYGGAVTPREAHRLQSAGAADVVDVRTLPEWEFVGHYPPAVHLPWRHYGESVPDDGFVDALLERFPVDRPLLFLCRSAVRSHHAAEAAAKAGFTHAFNILEGFEGPIDEHGHRGHLGWRAAGLPWRQG